MSDHGQSAACSGMVDQRLAEMGFPKALGLWWGCGGKPLLVTREMNHETNA
jgi:hypothetical protein